MKKRFFALLLCTALGIGLIGTAFAKTIWVDDGDGGLKMEVVPDDDPVTTPAPSTNPDPSPSTNPDPGPSTNPDPGPSTNPDPGPSTNPDPGPSTNPDPGPSTNPNPGSGINPEPSESTKPGSTNLPVSTGTTTDNQGSATETTAVPTATVQNGQATTTVDTAIGQEIVKQAVSNKSESVVIAPSVTGTVSKVEVSIPASTVEQLGSQTTASLTVSTTVADVVIPNRALASLGSGSGTVTVNASVSADSVAVTVNVQKNGQSVTALPEPLKVSAPVSRETAQAGSGVVAVLVNEDGTETVLPKSAMNTEGEMTVLVATGSATIKFVDKSKDFDDTANHWAGASIDFVSSRGLFQGVNDTTFGTEVKTSRAMMATVLYRLESEPAASGNSFADVPANAYYADAASWAAELGVTTGTGSGFNGNGDISREMMVTMLYRYMQKTAPNAGSMGSYAGMAGADRVSRWASEAMNWAVGSGLIQGDSKGLRPGDSTSRAEMAAVMQRFVGLLTK